MERNCNAEEEKDEDEQDEDEEEDQDDQEEDEEDEEEHEDEKENGDENDGKEPWMIGQGELVNKMVDGVDTMVDDQPIVITEQRQEMLERTSQPHPLLPTRSPQIQVTGC
jgi:hypothetical protein